MEVDSGGRFFEGDLNGSDGMNAPLPRGLIETSNICVKNCFYCGIRRGNSALARYRMSEDEVFACIAEARRRGYPAIALQAGEVESEANTVYYESILTRLTAEENAAKLPPLEVTLSLGEQTETVYRRWQAAAGRRVLRYLLRIETSNPELYAELHPADHSFSRRVECIKTLKRLGYVTGSGVMIGLPGQTHDDLERDLDWFEEMQLDMVGMGPYIPAADTPLGISEKGKVKSEKVGVECGWWTEDKRLETALWMIGEVRRRMPKVNIVAATALEALDPAGRELGLASGANVIMPDLTPEKYKRAYDLYPGKVTAR